MKEHSVQCIHFLFVNLAPMSCATLSESDRLLVFALSVSLSAAFGNLPQYIVLFLSNIHVEPRKMSIYRDESVETLIEALWQKDLSNTQMNALDALLFLIGQVNSSGKSYTEAWLLKIAGFDQPYNALMKAEQLGPYDNDLMETIIWGYVAF